MTKHEWHVQIWFPAWDADDVPDQEGIIELTEPEARETAARLDALEAEDLIGSYRFDLWEVPEKPRSMNLDGLRLACLPDDEDPEVVKDFDEVWNSIEK